MLLEMDYDLINEDSIVNLVTDLSNKLTQKIVPSHRPEFAFKKKDVFKMCFEILLNKRQFDIEDRRSDYPLEELLIETYYFISCRNRAYINKDVRTKISLKIDRLGELARIDSDNLSTVKSTLRMILMLNDHLPKRKIKGILKYREPKWFAARPLDCAFYRQLSAPNDLLMQSMMCIREAHEPSLIPNVKLKKSATWHECVMNALTSSTAPSSSTSSVIRPSSQTLLSLDEGFVTPDDFHREITPEPHKNLKPEPGWWCNWDVVGTPPSQYKTWESQWVLPVHREKVDLIGGLEPAYNALRIDELLKGGPVPPPLLNFVEPNQLLKDIVCLLCGLPSSTFQLTASKTFKIAEGTYTTGVMSMQLINLTEPFITFAETYQKIENYISSNKHYDRKISQAFYQSLHSYLFHLKSLIINTDSKSSRSEKMNKLSLLTIKPLSHMLFLWKLIESEINASCHQVLDRMYSSLPFIHDEELLCIINVVLLKCCYVYVDLFEKLIKTGVCAEELICEETGAVSTAKVPFFLRSLADIINNSTKTLKLLHKDPKMSLLKSKVLSKKLEKPQPLIIDHQELVKQHHVKFMKAKEEERARLAEKKAKQMSSIMDDIAAKQKWKQLEEMQLELRERKISEGYEKLDRMKEKLLDECKKDVEAKYDVVMRECDKKIALANWKLRRLAGENARSDIIKADEIESSSVREEFLKRGVDLSVENRDVLISPVEIREIEVETIKHELIVEPELEVPASRHNEALEIKKKYTEGTGDWTYDYEESNVEPQKVVDVVDVISLYEENRNKALAIKKKIMSSELTLNSPPSPSQDDYAGLSPSEREKLENDLIVFPYQNSQVEDPYFKSSYEFLKQKQKVKKVIEMENSYKFHDGVLNFIEMRHSFLTSAEAYLKQEIDVANKAILEHFKEDFVREVRWIIDHYLLLNATWAHNFARRLVGLIRQGTLNLLLLNRLLPPPLAVRTSRQSPTSFDPTDPSTIDFIILSYQPPEPLNHFISDRSLLKYNQNFLFLIKIEQSCWMLTDSSRNLRLKPLSSNQGLQYNQIHFHIHVMNNFMLNIKCFIFNSIERCWEDFSLAADKVTSLDNLHYKHIYLLKKSQFFCFQNKKSTYMREAVHKLLQCIYKYCETLRSGIISRSASGEFEHSLFKGLVQYFKHFIANSRYLYKYIVRLTDTGRANTFNDLREMLSINDFYDTL